MIPSRGFPRKPPSYHIERLRKAPLGYFFDVMTNGFGIMPDYCIADSAARSLGDRGLHPRPAVEPERDCRRRSAGQKVPSEPPQFRGTGLGRDVARASKPRSRTRGAEMSTAPMSNST